MTPVPQTSAATSMAPTASELRATIRAALEAFRQTYNRPRRLSIDQEVSVALSYARDLPLDAIAFHFDVSTTTVVNIAKRAGLDLRGTKAGPNSYQSMPRVVGKERARLLEAFVQNTESVDELSARYGISQRTLHRYARAAGLKRSVWKLTRYEKRTWKRYVAKYKEGDN